MVNKLTKLSVLLLLVCHSLIAQQQFVIDNNAYVKITDSAYLVINNPNVNAIITTPAGGNIISENEFNVVQWNIGTATGNYVIPFTTSALVKIPLAVNITAAGSGSNSHIIFSTYETATDTNTTYPSDVTNMNSGCNNNNALYAVDRFWRIDAASYTTKPTPIINFAYDASAVEIGGTNTITESKLKAERFNAGINSWETPAKLFGTDNAVTHHVVGAGITPANFYKSWTLIDTSIMTININFLSVSSNTLCSGTGSVLTPTGASTYTLLPSGNTTTSSFTVSPTSNTTYTISGTNAAGCLSSLATDATVAIAVNPTPTVSIVSVSSNTICTGNNSVITPSGASSYTLTSASGSSAGTSFTVSPTTNTTYTISGSNASGCISSSATDPTVNIIVNPTPMVGITSASSATICSGNSTIISPSGASTYTLTSAIGTITGTSFTVSPTINTTYTISGASVSGCTSATATNPIVNVTVNATPTITIASVSSNTICSGSNSVITPSGASSYTLNPGNITGTSFTVSPVLTTTYNVVGTDVSSGCASSSSNNTNITITVNATPTVGIISASSTTICLGNSTVINPSGANSYTLTSASSSIVGTSFTVSPTSNTSYTISGASALGCVSLLSTDPTVNVTVNPTPTINIASISSNTLCSGNSAVIIPSGASTYSLTPGNITGTSFTVSPTVTTTYTINASTLGCASSPATDAVVTITVNPILNITSALVNNISCFGQNNGSINLTVSGGTTPYIYAWSNSAFGNNLSSLSPGTYSVLVTDAGTCNTTQSFTVTEPANLAIATSTLVSACPEKANGAVTLNITGGTPAYAVSWNNGASGLDLQGLAAADYTATVTDNKGCTKTYSINIPVLAAADAACVDLQIPEIFSPNGDGKNDVFFIKKIDAYPNNTVSIFNRWGGLVYTKHGYANTWDGTPNVNNTIGKGQLPAGTYYVVLDFGDGVSKTYTGFVQLEY